MNYANLITSLRIFLIPIMILIFFLNEESPRYLLTFIFFIASTTDYIDGYIARKMELVTKLGKFLDPVADKLLVVTSLLLILVQDNIFLSTGLTPYLSYIILILMKLYDCYCISSTSIEEDKALSAYMVEFTSFNVIDPDKKEKIELLESKFNKIC